MVVCLSSGYSSRKIDGQTDRHALSLFVCLLSDKMTDKSQFAGQLSYKACVAKVVERK